MLTLPEFSGKQAYAEENKRQAQDLAHVERQSAFEDSLVFFNKLDHKSAGENPKEEQAQHVTRPRGPLSSIKKPKCECQEKIAESFIQHRRMAGKMFPIVCEDDGPGHLAWSTDNF